MHTLVIAEKPSVGRDIAKVIGAKTRGDNCLTGNGYVVSWAVGHLVTLKEPDELDEKYKKWRLSDLPILPSVMETKVIPQTRAQFSVLKKLMNDQETSDIICATDSGREGELIFRYIYHQAGCSKPVRRLWISSMTEEAIQTGFQELRPSSEYDALYVSAKCRAEADWLIGMNATRAFTLHYNVLLSIGRVQTPTLSMLVKRRLEIDAFKPEEYYTIQADFGDYRGQYLDENGQKRVPSKENASAIASRVKGKTGRITEAKREKKAEKPPLLFDLTSLQREANSRFGFTAKKTLSLAQDLYEKHKLLTYPRTDSRFLSHDMLGKVKQTLLSYDGELKPIGEAAVQNGIWLNKRIFDDAKLTDHHAIIPTGKKAETVGLSADERRLYDLVARRLAAVFYPNSEYETLRVITSVEEDRFVSIGKTVLQMGWKALAAPSKEKKREDSEEQDLPALTEGEERLCRGAKIRQEMTKPPKEHNDASLLAEMEHAGRKIEDENLREEMKDCGLGTPATRAAIIERLLQVGYVRRSGKSLIATEKGIKLIQAVPDEMASPEITGKWEQILSQIAKGQDRESEFRSGITALAAKLVKDAMNGPEVAFEPEERRGKGKKHKAPVSLGKCPLCGQGEVYENSKAFYCSRFRDGCRYTVWKNALVHAGGPEVTAKIMQLCLSQKTVRGSTGTILLREGGSLTFQKG